MNDDFLTHYRPVVRPEFAELLSSRLHQQARKQRRKQHMLGAVSAIVLLLSSLMILPEARAAVQRLIWEIGDMVFVECRTLEECAESAIDVRLAYADDPDQALTAGTYRIETIVDDLPFSLSLPKRVGGPYVYDNLVHVSWDGDHLTVNLNWYPKECIDGSCEAAMTLTIAQGVDDPAPLLPDGATTEAFHYFARGPATVYRDAHGESGIAWCEQDPSYYSQEALCYRLSWADPDLTLDRGVMTSAGNSLTSVGEYDSDRYVLFEELHAAYPDIVDFLPTWVPEGFTVQPERIIVSKYSSVVAMIWSAAEEPGAFSTAPWISMSVWVDRVPFAVKEGALQELKVDSHPAAIHEPMLDDDAVQVLMWRQYGLQYSLAWRTDLVSTEDVLRMAASVPETGKLPLPSKQMDDLLRLLLAEGELESYPYWSYPPHQ